MAGRPLDDRELEIFQLQVVNQCQFVLIAAEDIVRAQGAEPRDLDRMWYSIQSLLGAAANLSKLLWGQRGSRTLERKRLRESLEVSDTSPLVPTRMRNHFEHIDERVERWTATSEKHNFGDYIVGVESVPGLDETDTFRSYDPDGGIVRFGADSYDMRGIIREAARILPEAHRLARAREEMDPPAHQPSSTTNTRLPSSNRRRHR